MIEQRGITAQRLAEEFRICRKFITGELRRLGVKPISCAGIDPLFSREVMDLLRPAVKKQRAQEQNERWSGSDVISSPEIPTTF